VPLAYLFAEDDDQAELLLAFAQLAKGERTKLLAHVKRMVADKPRKRVAVKR